MSDDNRTLYSTFEQGDKWYSFWNAGVSEEGPIDDQELCVYFQDDRGNFIKELHKFADLRKASYLQDLAFTSGVMAAATQDELIDLMDIVRMFVSDVTDEYYPVTEEK